MVEINCNFKQRTTTTAQYSFTITEFTKCSEKYWRFCWIGGERAKYKNQNSPTRGELDMTKFYTFMRFLAFIRYLSLTEMEAKVIRCIMSKERCAFLLAYLRLDDPQTRNARKAVDSAAPISKIFDIFA